MSKKSTPIKITSNEEKEGAFKDEVSYEHESFGQVRCSNVFGQTELYGSSVVHHNWIEITISKSKKTRHLHHDNYYPGKQLITVALSHAQFSEMLCAMNTHRGVPCTIEDFDMKSIPSAESSVISKSDTYVKEFEKDIKDVMDKLNAITETMKALEEKPSLSKKDRAPIIDGLEKIKTMLNSNMPYVLKCFLEKVEGVSVEAKHEIEAFRSAVITQAGLEHIAQNAPKLIEENKSE